MLMGSAIIQPSLPGDATLVAYRILLPDLSATEVAAPFFVLLFVFAIKSFLAIIQTSFWCIVRDIVIHYTKMRFITYAFVKIPFPPTKYLYD
jgi:hypothetical protein